MLFNKTLKKLENLEPELFINIYQYYQHTGYSILLVLKADACNTLCIFLSSMGEGGVATENGVQKLEIY